MHTNTNDLHSSSFYKRPINWLILTLGGVFCLLLFLSLDMYNSRQNLSAETSYNLEVEELKGRITYYDEVLTMSARMASLSGDLEWEERYNEYVVFLDDALARAEELAPETYTSQLAAITSDANTKLIDMETAAFSAVKKGDTEKATGIMFSAEYQKQKDIYNKGITNFSIPKQLGLRLGQLKSEIVYLKEVLSMSTRMAAFTEDAHWENRYQAHLPILESAIHEAYQLLSSAEGRKNMQRLNGASATLIPLNIQVFDLVRKRQYSRARKIMTSKEYHSAEQTYTKHIEVLSSHIQSLVVDIELNAQKKTDVSIGIISLMIVLTAIVTVFVTRQVHRSERELERHNSELEHKTEELETFAYSLSHDLRAPLKTIQGFSRRLNKKFVKDGNDELLVYSEQISKNAVRLDNLIQDTLDITRSEKLSEEMSEVDLDQTIADIEQRFSEINRENPVQFVTEFNHRSTFYSQKTRINQILENLISNSIKYAKSEEHKPYVKVLTTDNVDGTLQVCIKDNGIGVPEEQHEKMFSMFFRAQSELSFGSGLGLYLVKKNVEKLGGEIGFNSSENGTEFIIRLPKVA